jgi:hypothetical protein
MSLNVDPNIASFWVCQNTLWPTSLMLLEGFCLCVKPVFSGYARYSDAFLTSTGEMAAVVKYHLKYTRFSPSGAIFQAMVCSHRHPSS